MPGATTTTLAALIAEELSEGISVHFRNRKLLPMFLNKDQINDTGIRRRFHYNGQSSAEFSEGDTPPAAGNQAYVEGTQAFRSFWVPIEVSGHAVDERQGPAGAGPNDSDGFLSALGEETSRALNDLAHGINTGLLDGSAGGLEGIIDSGSTTFMGLNRADTYPQLQSYESAVAGALSLAAMKAAMESLRDQPRDAAIDTIITAPNQGDNFTAIVDSTATNFFRGFANAGPQGLNLGFDQNQLGFQGAKIVQMPNLTNTVVLFLAREDFTVHWKRRVQVKELGPTRDHYIYLATGRLALGCRNPRKCGKLTGVTA